LDCLNLKRVALCFVETPAVECNMNNHRCDTKIYFEYIFSLTYKLPMGVQEHVTNHGVQFEECGGEKEREC